MTFVSPHFLSFVEAALCLSLLFLVICVLKVIAAEAPGCHVVHMKWIMAQEVIQGVRKGGL